MIRLFSSPHHHSLKMYRHSNLTFQHPPFPEQHNFSISSIVLPHAYYAPGKDNPRGDGQWAMCIATGKRTGGGLAPGPPGVDELGRDAHPAIRYTSDSAARPVGSRVLVVVCTFSASSATAAS